MDWLVDHWLDFLGWGGSALLVASLLQARVLRFRVLNLIACVILIVFNGLLAIWPMVAMNAVLSAINLWFIMKLLREQNDDNVFEVLDVAPGDTYLRHVLRVHGADISRFQPDFDADAIGANPGSSAYLVQRGDETVGVVVVEVVGETAFIRLDYVTPRFRDFSPGAFVWRHSGLLTSRGVRRIVSSPQMVGAYYDRVGFQPEGDRFVMELREG